MKDSISADAQVYRMDENVSGLFDRMIMAQESGAAKGIETLLGQTGLLAFVGAGGSYAAAVYASRVYNAISKDGYAIPLRPREFLYANYSKFNHVICISYSGTTHDIDCVIEAASSAGSKCYVITKSGKVSKIAGSCAKVISYNSSKVADTRERGFISIDGVISTSSLFAVHLYESKNATAWRKWLQARFRHWADFAAKLEVEIKDSGMWLDIFTGDYTVSPATDMESKCIETGLARVSLQEKKDFSHGRFSIMGYQKPFLGLFYSCQNGEYDELLLDYLRKQLGSQLLYVQSESSLLLGEFDLLIANQFILAEFGRRLHRDLGKLTLTNQEEALALHRYNGKL